jgi:hypothetical protein
MEEIFMKKALLVLVTLCVVTVLSCGSGGTPKAAPEPRRPVLPGIISGNLGDYTAINQATQKGWGTNGVDNVATDLEPADFINAKFLVLKLKSKPTGGLQVIWQGDGNSWTWEQQDNVLTSSGAPNAIRGATLSDDNVLTIELSKALKNYGRMARCTKIKLYLGYYSKNIDDLGVIQADLVSE